MDYNKSDDVKKFFHYFRVWIVLAVIAVVGFVVIKVTHKEQVFEPRHNEVAPAQRVYDFADVLTEEEEADLEEYISTCEDWGKCDIVLVTINEPMGVSDSDWNRNMMNWADDFYDEKAFGFNAPHGDGALILDNWYKMGEPDSQAGTWLSTSGKMENIIGSSEEASVFSALDDGFEISTYEAYYKAIKKTAYWGSTTVGYVGDMQLPWPTVVIVPLVIALIYAIWNMVQKAGEVTTTASTYVSGGKPEMVRNQDTFLRKSVSKVKIETESSSGGGSSGHHRSSGGYSHGGGGHRR